MLNNLNEQRRVQWEVDLEDLDKLEYLKRSMIYDRKATLEKISKEDPFMRCKDLDIEDIGKTIKTFANNYEHLYDPSDFIKMMLESDINKSNIRRLIKRLVAKESLYLVNVIEVVDGKAEPHLRRLMDSDGIVYMLIKAQQFHYPNSEVIARAFARTVNVFRSFMGITLSDYISSAVSTQAIKPMGELPVGNFLSHTDKIKFRFVSEYVLDKNNKVLLGDEEDLDDRLKESRKASKYMFYFDTTDSIIQDTLTKLYPDVLLEEIDKVLARYVEQAKFKFRAASNYGRVFITDKMLYDLVTYCAEGYTSMEPVTEALIKAYEMDEAEAQIFRDSFITLQGFNYHCDVTFFDEYQEIIKEYGLE